ncbi:cardiolipin synthase ClsB [Pusillimonas sp. TS35]|nr:cardiolipin synthase ClsB [Pusillimonas sp. TS35]
MPSRHLRLGWHDGNEITLLHNGVQFFPTLCDAIDRAHSLVHLETYIFSFDRTARSVLDHLERACQRGVKVRVVIDGFGSSDHVEQVCARLEAMGAQYRVYRPVPRRLRHVRLNMRILRRLHRKTAVIDGQTGFVGGINILDDYADLPDNGRGPEPRFDYAVCLRGPIVEDLIRAQGALWLRMAWRRRDDWAAFYQRTRNWLKGRQLRAGRQQPVFTPGVRAALLLRDNILHRQTVEHVYLATLASATDNVLIANAYFLPGRRLRKALADAAARGVRVRLLLQGHAEYLLQYRATRYMYWKMLDARIELYEYTASYLHAKVAAIDNCALVGSSNLDPFSLLLAREANVYVRNDAFAAQLARTLEEEIARNARRVTPTDLQRRGRIGHFIDGLSYLMLRIGVALTGKSSEY